VNVSVAVVPVDPARRVVDVAFVLRLRVFDLADDDLRALGMAVTSNRMVVARRRHTHDQRKWLSTSR